MGLLVESLRRHGELTISDAVAAQLVAMSAATIDRRLATDRAQLVLKGRSMTKPGTLLKSQIPIKTWVEWDDQTPGFPARSTLSATTAATTTACSAGR